MNKNIFMNYSLKDALFVGLPCLIVTVGLLLFAYKHLDPSPPDHFTIATGEDQSDLDLLAKEYQEILKQNGVRLDIRHTSGPMENLKLLQDEKSDVDAAFVQDGLGSAAGQPDVLSLGSLYYEPVWVFSRSKAPLTHFSQLEGKRIATGRAGHATHVITARLLKLNGVNPTNTKFVHLDAGASADALIKGQVDAAVFLLPPNDDILHKLALHPELKLMDMEQAEAIARRDNAFDHLVLPRGAIDLNADVPAEDTHLVSSTGTLVVRNDLHPALSYLLLSAASQLHSQPGILEKRNEFPSDKADTFPLSEDATQYYKSGGSFWQRHLPFWLAAWFDRFILLVIPIIAFVVPLFKVVPSMYHWRLRTRIYQRYGELKHIETQIVPHTSRKNADDLLQRLDQIEDRVNRMQMPRNFSEYIYSLKGHIQFVRDRLKTAAAEG
jgi:TRAP-type uncharacterized transport system substrate-binding protein